MKHYLQTFSTACQYLVAGMLMMSAVSHLDNQYLFLRSVYDYQLLPLALVEFVAAWIPWLQIVIAIALVTKVGGSGPKVVAVGLLGTFVFIQGVAYLNGSTASCGCFGYSQEAVGPTSIAISTICTVLAATTLLTESDANELSGDAC